MKNHFKLKHIDSSLNAKQAWQEFCVKLLSNLNKIEEETITKDAQMRNSGQTFSERKYLKNKLNQCKKYREIIKKSAKEKVIEIKDGDEEVILNLGWDYYFKYMNCNL